MLDDFLAMGAWMACHPESPFCSLSAKRIKLSGALSRRRTETLERSDHAR